MLVSSIYKRNYFETASEYRIALVLALELSRRGIRLDFTGMKTKAKLNSVIYAGLKVYLKEQDLADGIHNLDKEYYEFTPELNYLGNQNLFEDNHEYLYWDEEWSYETFGSYHYRLISRDYYQFYLETMFAKHWVDHILGIESRSLCLSLSYTISCMPDSYMNIYSVISSLNLENVAFFKLDERANVNLDLTLFKHDSVSSGFDQEYSVDEKLNFMNQYGIKEGMVIAYFERKGINASNSLGKIDDAHIARVDEIVNGNIYLSLLRVQRTHEETLRDYYDIPKENRHLYDDLLEPHSSIYDNTVLSIRDCGVGSHFYREPIIIDTISTTAMVTKLVSKDGETVSLSMNEAEAIYYTLKQNGASIDYDLYREYYFNGNEGLYDIFNGSSGE